MIRCFSFVCVCFLLLNFPFATGFWAQLSSFLIKIMRNARLSRGRKGRASQFQPTLGARRSVVARTKCLKAEQARDDRASRSKVARRMASDSEYSGFA